MIVFGWIVVGIAAGYVTGGLLGEIGSNHPGDIGRLFVGGVMGVLLGAAGGAWLGWTLKQKYAGDERKRLWVAASPWIGLALVVAAGFAFETIRTWDNLLPSGGAAKINCQIRLPAGALMPARDDVLVELRTEKETRRPDLGSKHVERVGDRVVITAAIETYRTANTRIIALRIGQGPTYLFKLDLPARPPLGAGPGLKDTWHRPGQVDDNIDGKPPRAPQAGENPEIRYEIDMY